MKVEVCLGARCSLLGGMNIYEQIDSLNEIVESNPDLYRNEHIEVEAVKCQEYCKTPEKPNPIVIIDGEPVLKSSVEVIMSKVLEKLKIG